MKAGDTIREYILESIIGEGGMARIWQARHIHLDRLVALKILQEDLTKDPQFEARFFQEARAMSRLHHPNILEVLDFFVQDRQFCLVLPFVKGGSLKDLLSTRPGPLPLPEVYGLILPVLDALHFAHRQGVVHRDVKPANILIAEGGKPVLTDFGIALVTGEERKTVDGRSLGTPHYMSPEQIRDPFRTDCRTDLYSLTCVLFEMLTGEPPFPGTSYASVLVAQCTQAPPDPGQWGISAPLARILLKGLEKDPGDRYAGVAELAAALEEVKLAAGIAGLMPVSPGTAELAGEKKPHSRLTKTVFDQVQPSPDQPAKEPAAMTLAGAGEAPAGVPVINPLQRTVDGFRRNGLEKSAAGEPPAFDQLKPEESLSRCVEYIGSRQGLPAFAHSVAELLTASAGTAMPAQQLANLILKNLSLTAKILRLVNSVYFNRSSQSILSVSHAVIMLGWNRIRDLAAGLLLFDQVNRNFPGVKELMLLSLLTASQARQISARLKAGEPEPVYLAGMFSSLGELMVACYLPRNYARILEGTRSGRWAYGSGCRSVLHFSYDDLGKAMLRQWGLPEVLTLGMEAPERVDPRLRSPEEMMKMITVFSRELSASVYCLEAQESQKRLRFLLKRFGEALALDEQKIDEVLRAAVEETRDTLAAVRIPLDNLRLSRHIRNALEGLRATGIVPAEEPAAVETPVPVPPVETGENGTAFSSLADEVDAVLDSGESYDLNDLVMMILESVFRGGAFDRAIFCIKESDHQHIHARLGVGVDVERLIEKFRFPISLLSGPVGPVMLGRREVFVEEAADSRFRQSAIVRETCARSFGMCPLIVRDLAIGCFYFDRLSGELNFSQESRRRFSRLVKKLGQMLEKKASGSASSQ